MIDDPNFGLYAAGFVSPFLILCLIAMGMAAWEKFQEWRKNSKRPPVDTGVVALCPVPGCERRERTVFTTPKRQQRREAVKWTYEHMAEEHREERA